MILCTVTVNGKEFRSPQQQPAGPYEVSWGERREGGASVVSKLRDTRGWRCVIPADRAAAIASPCRTSCSFKTEKRSQIRHTGYNRKPKKERKGYLPVGRNRISVGVVPGTDSRRRCLGRLGLRSGKGENRQNKQSKGEHSVAPLSLGHLGNFWDVRKVAFGLVKFSADDCRRDDDIFWTDSCRRDVNLGPTLAAAE